MAEEDEDEGQTARFFIVPCLLRGLARAGGNIGYKS